MPHASKKRSWIHFFRAVSIYFDMLVNHWFHCNQRARIPSIFCSFGRVQCSNPLKKYSLLVKTSRIYGKAQQTLTKQSSRQKAMCFQESESTVSILPYWKHCEKVSVLCKAALVEQRQILSIGALFSMGKNKRKQSSRKCSMLQKSAISQAGFLFLATWCSRIRSLKKT